MPLRMYEFSTKGVEAGKGHDTWRTIAATVCQECGRTEIVDHRRAVTAVERQ